MGQPATVAWVVWIVFNDSETEAGDVFWGPFFSEAEAIQFQEDWPEDTEVEDVIVVPLNTPEAAASRYPCSNNL